MRTSPRIMPALITAFTPDGDLDESGHRHNVSVMVSRGLSGVVLAGSTGEGPYLEPGERKTLTTIARDEMGTAGFVVTAVSAESVRQSSAQIGEAASGGADAVLVITPTTLVRGRDTLVEQFYLDVADVSPLPVVLYNAPTVTGYDLPVAVIAQLAEHPVIVGIKDSTGKPERVGPILRAAKAFVVFCGTSRTILASVEAGAHGAITASSNYASDLATAALEGDVAAQNKLSVLTADIESRGVPGTKAAAVESGLTGGTLRKPLR